MTTVDRDTVCPWCSYEHDSVGGVGTEEIPGEGDLTICIKCGRWSFFASGQPGGLRKPNKVEGREIADDPDCQRVERAWRASQEGAGFERGRKH